MRKIRAGRYVEVRRNVDVFGDGRYIYKPENKYFVVKLGDYDSVFLEFNHIHRWWVKLEDILPLKVKRKYLMKWKRINSPSIMKMRVRRATLG